jgi:hypothetical protein
MKRYAERVTTFTLEEPYFVDPQYIGPIPVEEPITKTGHLRVFELRPAEPQPHLPIFIGRWDEKARALDIDSDAKGFSGHHTTPLDRNTRSFLVDIRVAERPIFQGIVTLSFYLGARGVSGSMIATCKPAGTKGST